HGRNVNMYGQYGARLDRTATVEDKRHENLWVDRIIYTHHWRALLHDLYQEWTMAAGGAGVMWASNMVPINTERKSCTLTCRETVRPGYDVDSDGQLPRHPDTTASTRVTTINSSMRIDEVMHCLVEHGCQDITGELDPSSVSGDPIAYGGTSNIYHAKLRDGTEVAVKCLFNLRNLEASSEGVKILKYVQLAEALEYMHTRGIVHGDIKAANVLMSNDNTPLFTDFGNALLMHGATLQFTKTTSLGITHRYTAPEILKGDSRYSTKADIYAFAMLVLEIVTGRAPFADKSAIAIVYTVTIKREIPGRPNLSSLFHNKTLEDELWRLLTTCWAYKPNNRPSAPRLRKR
ncbi:hypothetical protein FRC06_008018, partial [Ceratobasidium sp. 370]